MKADDMQQPDMRQVVGSHDIVMITLDTLRYDVAQQEFAAGRLPVISAFLPPSGWQHCHSPASFTYAAHQAFFAGFLPTPVQQPKQPRLFACEFAGSETSNERTCLLHAANLPQGLAAAGYHTVCIGGTGFFNQQTALGKVLPQMFMESHWRRSFGTGSRHSSQSQVAQALTCMQAQASTQRLFVFINIAAIHQPNRAHLPGCQTDNLASHAAALRYVDGALAPLFAACARRAPTFVILCSDHGSAYGEDGYHGHRLAHPTVWDVPYAHFFIPPASGIPTSPISPIESPVP